MSILLKQSYFSTFTSSKPIFRQVPQQSHVTLVWRGIGSTFGSHKTFLGNQHGLSYKLIKSDLGENRDPAQPGENAYFVNAGYLLQ